MVVYFILLIILYCVFRILLNSDKASGLEKLREEVTTEENEDRVDRLFKYHSNRVNAGASEEESFARLINDLRNLKSNR